VTGPHKKVLRIGEILVQQGVTTPDQIEIGLLEQKKSKEKLGKILVRLGFATEAIIRDVIGGVIGKESVNLDNAVADSEAVAMIPKNVAQGQELEIRFVGTILNGVNLALKTIIQRTVL